MAVKKTVLLDLDNTLIDFNKCARQAIINIFRELKFPYTERVFKVFIEENVKIWKKLENGEISKAQLRAQRWNIILRRLGIEYDGSVVEEMFEQGVASGAYAVDGAYELLDYLYSKYELYIVSNGFRHIQENRLKKGNFQKYFKDTFFSEDIGFQKPSANFFDYCFKKTGISCKNEVILIGDSLSADIVGGLNYGIDVIWFNRDISPLPNGIKPTYTVTDLMEIKEIL